jgi:hypothetical protein
MPRWVSHGDLRRCLDIRVMPIATCYSTVVPVYNEAIGRIYDEAKQRPLYLVGEIAGFKKLPSGR